MTWFRRKTNMKSGKKVELVGLFISFEAMLPNFIFTGIVK
jgi:hypothetical protein